MMMGLYVHYTVPISQLSNAQCELSFLIDEKLLSRKRLTKIRMAEKQAALNIKKAALPHAAEDCVLGFAASRSSG
jgi:hypothetical protein